MVVGNLFLFLSFFEGASVHGVNIITFFIGSCFVIAVS